jgi:hypothetical protein
MTKFIVICCDGTWNRPSEPNEYLDYPKPSAHAPSHRSQLRDLPHLRCDPHTCRQNSARSPRQRTADE